MFNVKEGNRSGLTDAVGKMEEGNRPARTETLEKPVRMVSITHTEAKTKMESNANWLQHDARTQDIKGDKVHI